MKLADAPAENITQDALHAATEYIYGFSPKMRHKQIGRKVHFAKPVESRVGIQPVRDEMVIRLKRLAPKG